MTSGFRAEDEVGGRQAVERVRTRAPGKHPNSPAVPATLARSWPGNSTRPPLRTRTCSTAMCSWFPTRNTSTSLSWSITTACTCRPWPTSFGQVRPDELPAPAPIGKDIYSGDVDRFSHLVIFTAVWSLASGHHDLWHKLNDGENLLFRESDFHDPRESELFHALWRSLTKIFGHWLAG